VVNFKPWLLYSQETNLKQRVGWAPEWSGPSEIINFCPTRIRTRDHAAHVIDTKLTMLFRVQK
jgi:hypothetical protein